MSHCIKEHDRGAVGFTDMLGKTWHGVKSYKHFDGPVNREIAERIVDYEVIKKPLFMEGPSGNKPVEKAFCLYRSDKDTILYPNVGETYEVVSNLEMLKYLDGIFTAYGNLAIESIGTLNNGQMMFVNVNVVNHTVNGDVSPTITRLMFTNAYGGAALSACLHQTRVVCMNTVRVATAQGKANETLKRFRHTKNVSSKVNAHVIDLAAIVGEVRKHNDLLDHLATKPVSSEYVVSFLENMFPTEDKDGQTKTIAQNKQSAVRRIFEVKPDLQVLDTNRYRLLNAVTDYTSHEMSITDSKDAAKRFMNVAQAGGVGDKLNQKALQLLSA